MKGANRQMIVKEDSVLSPMKTVWIVVKHCSDDKTLMDYSEIVGVYATEKRARVKQEELINENARDVLYMDCDPIDVVVEECEVA